MKVPPIPKRLLIHSIEYRAYQEPDKWGNGGLQDPITINSVRVDDSTVFSRDPTQTKVLANAVVFVDAKHSTPLPSEFTEQSKVVYNGKEMTVQKVVPVYQPYKNEIRHWELEVI